MLLFMQELGTLKPLSFFDVDYLAFFSERFSTRSPDEQLNEDDFSFILRCFALRWQLVEDSGDHDYTLNPTPTNKVYINFAKILAPSFLNKEFFQILMPSITNNKDFNYPSLLVETQNCDNFYLGNDSKTLYRKRGLCEHLVKNDFTLSTCRDLSQLPRLTTLSIDELTRIERCKQDKGAFSIGEEQFDSFWQFMQTKVFPRLQDHGKIPLIIMPNLIYLIEQYFVLKACKGNLREHFKTFKMLASNFFGSFLQYDLHNINYLYGIQLLYRGKLVYLLDLFIAINKASIFNIDLEMESIADCLYRISPILKVDTDALLMFYANIESQKYGISSAPGSSTDIHVSLPSLPINQAHPCFNLILSLLTTEFDMFPLSRGEEISLWDNYNIVFYEAAKMYCAFTDCLVNDRYEDLLLQYASVHKELIAPCLAQQSWFSSRIKWFKYAALEKLDMLDVHWHEPEVILQCLIMYKHSNSSITGMINGFINELLHTYAQDNAELLKRFRVNILFRNFLKSLSYSEQKTLNIFLGLLDYNETKNAFLQNCNDEISRHVEQQIPLIELTNPSEQNVAGLISIYKREVGTNGYLMRISAPIVSLAEMNAATLDVPDREHLSSSPWLG